MSGSPEKDTPARARTVGQTRAEPARWQEPAEEPTRERVRATIGRVGGYWRPLAAVARLQEELGELAELSLTQTDVGVTRSDVGVPSRSDVGVTQGDVGVPSRSDVGVTQGDVGVPPRSDADMPPRPDAGATRDAEADLTSPEHIASELADLWIITTALADQFLGAVAEPGSHMDHQLGFDANKHPQGTPAAPRDLLGGLVAGAGRLARIVNYYDGPKTPRTFEGWISLGDAVADFHRALARAARALHVNLDRAVAGKLDAIPVLDSERFRAGGHDPSTAASLDSFRATQAPRSGSGIAPAGIVPARLWGSPRWSSEDPASSLDSIVADLVSFTKAAPWEGLSGYVISGPTFTTVTRLDDWLTHLLVEISARDPTHARLRADPEDGWVEDPKRCFSFNGMPLLVSVVSPLHGASDSFRSTSNEHHSPAVHPSSGVTFALLQAEGFAAGCPE